MENNNTAQQLAEIDKALRTNRLGEAEPLCIKLTTESPDFLDGWVAFARLRQLQGDYVAMRQLAGDLLNRSGNHPNAVLLDVEARVHLGEIKKARSALTKLEKRVGKDASILIRLSESYSQFGAFADAARTASLAQSLEPQNVEILYGLSSSLFATGDLEGAEKALDGVLAQTPYDYDAYYNRATLRKQTPARNHIDEIRRVMADTQAPKKGIVQLNYALAKELEDLGQDQESFAALKKGADARRNMMAYKVDGDVATMRALASGFDASYFENTLPGCAESGPIFILGLPRSGTTLVDRILSAHSQVDSLGEIIEFAMSLTSLCAAEGGKLGLIEASKKLDPAELGQLYVKRSRQRSDGSAFFIDKTPVNFLYIGLIATALPNARIVHLNRNPMDVGFAMYKTLFRMGYPFSYNFNDLAAYMKAKDELMDHWRRMLPGRIIDVDYESIVDDQEAQSRRLVEAIGLDWEEACLKFHENKSPSATASAAQVRQPLYKSAVGRWHRYEEELAPLAGLLGVKL